ncbi:hypothetical protein [Larkinella rosea]|uniref:Uncharacterized protein n=1 Tax=Larkinella rosea TaxID=2025312 RepID=A0A3P1C1X9_9BACT|nr:hypothetical protein [Larkinella rosea]RRB07073.1 hypothetical protein EHT25_04630 [Larkinella rosea]
MKRNHQILFLLIIIGLAASVTYQAQPPVGPGPVAFAGLRPPQTADIVTYNIAFSTRAALAVVALGVLWVFVPETSQK